VTSGEIGKIIFSRDVPLRPLGTGGARTR